MDETATTTDWHRHVVNAAKQLLRWALALAVGGAILYLGYGSGALEWRLVPDWAWPYITPLIGGLLVGALLTVPMDQFHWYGVIPAPAAEGHAWRRSIRSRLGVIGANLVNFWLWPAIFDMAQQAYFRADWPRTAVASTLSLLGVLLFLRMSYQAVSWRAALAIDSEGIREGEGGALLPWRRVERIAVSGDLDARRVTLMTLKENGALGPAHTLELGVVGIPARRFLALVEDLAPQVEIVWPKSRFADFSVA